MIANRERFEALPADLRAIVAHAAEAEHLANVSRVHASNAVSRVHAGNAVALRRLREDHGVRTGVVADAVLTRIGETASDILAEARARIRAWTELSEDSFMAARRLPFAFPSAG